MKLRSLSKERKFGLFLFFAVLVYLSACSTGKASFRAVQVDLANQQGVTLFIEEMKAIAREEKMEYVDGSQETERGLRTIGVADPGRTGGSPTIHLGVQRSDGMGLTAIDVSLPNYRVALGFTEGSDGTEARRFADRVVSRLEKHWRVVESTH